MNTNDLKQLRNVIQALSKEKQVHIFKIFDNNNVVYTENNNGIFINLTEVNEIVLYEIKKYLDYINKQEHQIEIVETQKEELSKLLSSQ